MTTKRTYFCNFCKAEGEPNREMIGLYWVNGGRDLEQRAPVNTEHHLCVNCCKALGDLLVVSTDRTEEPTL